MSVTIPVVSTPDVLNGTTRIEGTRISVQHVGTLIRDHGWSRGAVCDAFELSVDEISAALDYYNSHLKEMERIGGRRDRTYDRLRKSSRATD